MNLRLRRDLELFAVAYLSRDHVISYFLERTPERQGIIRLVNKESSWLSGL